MTSKSFDFYQDHSLHFLEMALSTDYMERVENPDGHGKHTGECGDTAEFFLMKEGPALSMVCFVIDGCVHTQACCNTIVRLALGKSIDAAWEITPDAVAGYLQTLPDSHYHCAELSVGAFYRALSDLGISGP